MRQIPVTCEQREAMLRALGLSATEELFADVPPAARIDRPLDLPTGLSEMELVGHLRGLTDANAPATELVSFAGAGCYDHYVPAIVDHVLRKPEFFTAYTPYQPEVSQGTLQATYEFQTMICELTGMDVANASMYDGATALAEAAQMACRITGRHALVCAPTVHPEWRRTLLTYAEAGTAEVSRSPATDVATGTMQVLGQEDESRKEDHPSLASVLSDERAAAVLVAQPNFFGNFEDLSLIAELTHEAGALLVVAVNPLLLGVLEPPSAYGADIVVGDGQPLGIPMSFGGPGLGFFACRKEHLRQMPGRLVGRSRDVDGNEAFVLTLSTREQHIRREKATSNICSNQALCSLAAGVYLAAVGSEGLSAIARACIAKAHYLRERLLETGRFGAPWETPFGYEFALIYDGDVVEMRSAMLERGFLAGVCAGEVEGGSFAGIGAEMLESLVLLAVTERRTRAEMDLFAEEVASL